MWSRSGLDVVKIWPGVVKGDNYRTTTYPLFGGFLEIFLHVQTANCFRKFLADPEIHNYFAPVELSYRVKQ
jgi:hypothetical protein